jgi:hypothetical protein
MDKNLGESMNLTLQRTQVDSTGCYGILRASSPDDSWLAVTLEHTYNDGHGNWTPKIPANTYTCMLGSHQLVGAPAPENLYELQDVPGHTGILIHSGNVDGDSSGCILLGQAKQGNEITNSRATLERIMSIENGMSFQLTVLDVQDSFNQNLAAELTFLEKIFQAILKLFS